MSLLSALGALVGGALLGAVAWRRVSATMLYRSYNSTMRPDSVAQEDYASWSHARRKRGRLLKVVAAVAVGAVLGAMLATMVGAGFGYR